VTSSDVPKLKSSVPMMTAAAEGPGLEPRNLYRFYQAGEKENVALPGVSLTVGPGTTVAVLGPSRRVAVLAALMGAGARTSTRPAVEELREL
jgi:hypothetical protein